MIANEANGNRSNWAEACAALSDGEGRIVSAADRKRTKVVFSTPVDYTGELETHVEQTPEKQHGDPRFYRLLNEISVLHSAKSHDYTPAGDPLANFHRAERFGVPAWKGTLVRMGDKWGRLEQLASGKDPANESLRDTLVDMAVYSLLCVLLLEDERAK